MPCPVKRVFPLADKHPLLVITTTTGMSPQQSDETTTTNHQDASSKHSSGFQKVSVCLAIMMRQGEGQASSVKRTTYYLCWRLPDSLNGTTQGAVRLSSGQASG